MRLLLLGALVLGGLVACAQTYGPGELYYGGIRLQFSGQVQVVGSCSGPYQVGPGVSELRCEVQAGTTGRVTLTATRTPASAVNIRAEALPTGWPTFSTASGWGTVTAQYQFPVPNTPGQTYLLRFKAWTAGVVGELEFRLSLTVRGAMPPSEPEIPPTYGPFTGTTDGTGRFTISIPTLPNTSVTGTLTECTVHPLPQTRVSVILVPKAGVVTITRADQIGAVRVSSPGYAETTVTQLQLLSSTDIFGRVYTTVGLGTVCLRATAPKLTPTAPIQGRTDTEGKFSVPLPWPGVTVTGRLTVCTLIPLSNQEFGLTLVPKGEVLTGPGDIAGFTFSAPGYKPTTVTQFSRLSIFGLTWYDTGPVCLLTETPLCSETELRVLTQNMMLFHVEELVIHGERKRLCFARRERAEELQKLLGPNGAWRKNFDIICLQEVWHFTRSGHFQNKNAVLEGWLGKCPDLDRDANWHTLKSGEKDTIITIGGQRVRLLRRYPQNAAKSVRIAIFEVEGRYVLIGPDSTSDIFGGSTYDSGLVILSKYPVIEATAFIFSKYAGDETYANKGVLYARILLTKDNPDCYIHVFNTHLQAGETQDDQNVRSEQLRQLVDFIEKCTSDDQEEGKVRHPVLVCGDFNIIGGSEEWKARLQNFAAAGVNLKDIWLQAGKAEGKDGATWVGNNQDTTGTPWGNPGGKKEGNVLATGGGKFQRLDYIFFWPGLQPLQLQLLLVMREPEKPGDQPYQWGNIASYTISDHLGVVGLFKVIPK